jgi:hypothetical protein
MTWSDLPPFVLNAFARRAFRVRLEIVAAVVYSIQAL